MLDGLFSLANISLKAVSGLGLTAVGHASMLGLSLDANVTIPQGGGFPSVYLKASNVKLGPLVSDARIWADAPASVLQRLGSLTFPAFELRSYSGAHPIASGVRDVQMLGGGCRALILRRLQALSRTGATSM